MTKNKNTSTKKASAAKSQTPKLKTAKPAAKTAKITANSSSAKAKKAVSKTTVATKSSPAVKSASAAKAKLATKAAPPAKKPVKTPAKVAAAIKPANGAKANPAAKVIAAAVAKPARAPAPSPKSAQPQRAMPAAGKAPAAKVAATPAPKAMPAAAPKASASDDGAKKQVTARHGFKTNELIVYPAHGVGRIIGIEEQEIAGMALELFVIEFEKDKMTLRVPTSKSASVGMRKLAEDGIVTRALDTLKGRARIKRTMWSRRAQEYEAKINSGDLVAIAEVVRDLYRSEAQPEQSYSERQLYEAALDRMARELAAVERSDERGAMQRITEILSKSARGRRAAAEAADAAAEDGADNGSVKAA